MAPQNVTAKGSTGSLKRSASSSSAATCPEPKKQRRVAVPAQTSGLRRFISENPRLADKAKRFDKMARDSLQNKYAEFSQGNYHVVHRRTFEDAPGHIVQAGIRDPSTEGSRPKYYCPRCRDFKYDIRRHLEIHNRHPAKTVYCPVCLEEMPRDDTATLPEHVLKLHPDYIFGAAHNPLQDQQRILQLGTTTDDKVLGRLNSLALVMFIKKDQPTLVSLAKANGHDMASVRKHLCNKCDIDMTNLFEAAGGDNDTLASADQLRDMRKEDLLIYLRGIRHAIAAIEANEV